MRMVLAIVVALVMMTVSTIALVTLTPAFRITTSLMNTTVHGTLPAGAGVNEWNRLQYVFLNLFGVVGLVGVVMWVVWLYMQAQRRETVTGMYG